MTRTRLVEAQPCKIFHTLLRPHNYKREKSGIDSLAIECATMARTGRIVLRASSPVGKKGMKSAWRQPKLGRAGHPGCGRLGLHNPLALANLPPPNLNLPDMAE
jgi:hypothetical protein